MRIQVASRTRPKIGEKENGDRPVYQSDAEGRHLFAVVDALGHGPGAAEVSDKLEAFLLAADLGTPLLDLMRGCHQVVAGMRGAAMTLCINRDGKLEACGVGNVEMRSGSLTLPLLVSPGILGVRVAKFRCCEILLSKPGRIAIFSDGISTRVKMDELTELSPEQSCEAIMKQYSRDYDDATILVADLETST